MIEKPKDIRTFSYPEWNLEFTEIRDWDKSYNEIKLLKGFRLPEVWELWRLLDSEHRDEFLGDYKGKHNVFACEQTNYDKEYDLSRWLSLGKALDLTVSEWEEYLDCSDSDGRLVMVSDITNENLGQGKPLERII